MSAVPLGGRRVGVIAIGDLGRSPRMLNHALELARSGAEVDLVGLDGAPIADTVTRHPGIRLHRLRGFEGLRWRRGRVGFLALAALRQLLIGAQVAYVLVVRLRRTGLLLLQNPPAFPALPLLLAHRSWHRARLVLDWHQTTTAMLELRLRSLGRGPGFVAWLGRLEGALARRADGHLCVSEALRELLARRWGIAAAVVPDLAPERFARRAAVEVRPGAVRATPALVVAPSGWSNDDDFDLLVAALQEWDARLSRCDGGRPGPHARFLLTGRGERREAVEATLRQTRWRQLEVRTAWFSPEEYPAVLASADLGLSVHASANGLDVPIKLCELLACGVPVLCLDYGPAVRERIRDGANGRLFGSAAELVALLEELLGNFPDAPALDRLRAGVHSEPLESWESSWRRSVLTVLPGSR